VIRLFRNQRSLIGSVRATAEEIRRVVGLVADRALTPAVHAAFPLTEAADAHWALEERRQYGKLILVP
jgi:NADPH:quinone reductase-like Zn-dependent oxidoreductase